MTEWWQGWWWGTAFVWAGMLFNMVMARRADRSEVLRNLDARAVALHEMGKCNPARSQQMAYAAKELRAVMKDLM